jgi:DNA (cytosine-5)-methyltransferase 1
MDRALRPRAFCSRCDVVAESVQSFKKGKTVGRYRQTYLYCCSRCGAVVEPFWLPAAAAIDWSIPGERVGDRLKPKTRARIAAGIARYWGPLTLEATGNTYDAADPNHPRHGELDAYYRSWPVEEALRTLHTANSKALAVPVEGRDGKSAWPLDVAMRTQTTRLETALAQMPPFVAEMYGTSTARPTSEPAGTFTAGGNHHALVQSYYGNTNEARPATDALGTLTTVDRYALIQRMNSGGAEMTTPAMEEMRTLTTAGHQALMRQPERKRLTPADLKAAEEMVPEVLFRMFRPSEVAAGMAFPADYKWQPPDRLKPVSNRDLVKATGNAVTPPCARDLLGVAVDSMAAA